jgi:hypothetical protein
MRFSIKLLFLLSAVFSIPVVSFGLPASEVNLPALRSFVFDDEDETPEVTDRVARVSFLEGDAKIRRNGSDEWETVTLNLPLVEGDELSTEENARIEIQFSKDKHLRIDENSFLRLTTLKEGGIAVSLSAGRASLMAIVFDKSRSFFEIDAPKVTIAVQKAGRYLLEAGEQRNNEVRLTIDQGGEARVYSENAGFTLKDRRSARVFTDGPNAGEWETSASFSSNDAFASWVIDREEIVARRLRDAHYDKYYDQDIYGADDLGDNGDWVNTNDYGYVWRPSRLATAQYSNWSPYRYGHWRWMPPYGWTWVADEPWGWATYHHGRWFNYNGGWVWSPYGYYRQRRSWWSPALVVINIYNNNVCWYPLSYHRRRNNYNWHYQRNRFQKVREPIVPLGGPVGSVKNTGRMKIGKDPIDVPTTGVVTTDVADFGKRKMRVMTAPEPIAKTVVTKMPDGDTQPMLPDYKQKRRSLDIATERPKVEPVVNTRVGAGPKRTDGALDGELQKTRIFGGRTPQKQPDADGPEPVVRSNETRKTGAVDRPPTGVRQPDERVKSPERDPESVRQPPTRQPIYTAPPQRDEKPRYTPPVKETPRYEPPPRQYEKPRNEPPPVKQPQRNDPPPSPKSEPKSEPRPAPSRKEKPDSQ